MNTTSPRTRIVEAASDLFYRHGIGSVGMDTVRDEAQVSLRALYKEFPSKEELMLAALRLRHDQWEKGLAAQAHGMTEPSERLLAIFDYIARWSAEPSFRGCGFINAFGELGPSSPRITRYVREHKQSFQRYVHNLVAETGGPATLAAQLALLAEGAQTTAAIAGNSDAAHAARQAAATLLADAGLLTPTP